MTNNDLVDAVAAARGLTKADAKALVETVFAVIGDAAARGEDVAVNNFGKFSVKHMSAQEGRNPRTGEPMVIAARVRLGFKAGKALKDKISA